MLRKQGQGRGEGEGMGSGAAASRRRRPPVLITTWLRRLALAAACALLFPGAPLLAQSGESGGKASITVDAEKAKTGAKLWTAKTCAACHTIGKGVTVGPDLAGVFERRERAWLVRWLKEPDAMLATDSTAKALLAEYKGIPMPNLGLTDAEVEALLHYIAQESAKSGGS